jgi:hypothetical protein
MSDELPEADEIRRLQLHPDDILVLRYKAKLTSKTVDRLKQAVQRVLGTSNRVMVLDSDAQLDVLAPDEVAPASDAAGIAEAMRKAKENPGRVVGVGD